MEKEICLHCSEELVGFSTPFKGGVLCEDCANYFTCEECGSVENEGLDGGLCSHCEAEHGE